MSDALPFEDPRISDLRSRCEAAIETAGYELVTELVKISPPESAGLHGKIVGHCQSLTSRSERYVYYAQIDGSRALSGFLSGVATAAQDLDDCSVYVVVTETSSLLEKSCRSSGAGLLRLTEENSFELLVRPDEYSLVAKHKELVDRGKLLRRRLETRFRLNEEHLRANFKEVEELTSGMEAAVRDEYILGIHRAMETWSEWFDAVGTQLDDALARDDAELLERVERTIEAGAIVDDGSDPGDS